MPRLSQCVLSAPAASLAHFPDRGRRVPKFRDPAVRELGVDSYRLIDRVRPSLVTVLAFIHGARDLGVITDPEQ